MSQKHVNKPSISSLNTIEPQTENQEAAFRAFRTRQHINLLGSAGTGKTFLAMYHGLLEVLERGNSINRIVLIRSIVPTRDIGYLPGTHDEKLEHYEEPYIPMCAELFDKRVETPYQALKDRRLLEVTSSSYLRGITFSNAFVIVDECENLNFHELDTVCTRIGRNSRLVLCGDTKQTDLKRPAEQNGLVKFLDIMGTIPDTATIEFGWQDIVRSDFVRHYIIAKEQWETDNEKQL